MITIMLGALVAGIFIAYGIIFFRIVRYEYEMECIYRCAKTVLRNASQELSASAEISAKRSAIKKDYEQAIEIVCKKQRRLLKLVPHVRRAYL